MSRRMLLPRSLDEGQEEHDWDPDCCELIPKCVPVDPNSTEDAVAATPTHINVSPVKYDPPPSHYQGEGMSPWDVWDAFGLNEDAYLANVVKYVLRAGKKDIATKLDDLKKARNYINKAIELEEKGNG